VREASLRSARGASNASPRIAIAGGRQGRHGPLHQELETCPADWEAKDDLLQTIGNTPLVRLNRVTAGLQPTVVAKVEFFNPGGLVVECTSGNTGMGIALAGAVKGYHATFTMTDKMSQEKIRLLRALGVRVVGVDPEGSILAEYIRQGSTGEARPSLTEGIGEDIVPTALHREIVLLDGYDPTVGEVLERRPAGVPRLVAVTSQTPMREAIALIRRYDVSQLPVLEGERNLGVLTEARILRLALEDAAAMERPVVTAMDPALPEIALAEKTGVQLRGHLRPGGDRADPEPEHEAP
jgi:hypothetical protein